MRKYLIILLVSGSFLVLVDGALSDPAEKPDIQRFEKSLECAVPADQKSLTLAKRAEGYEGFLVEFQEVTPGLSDVTLPGFEADLQKGARAPPVFIDRDVLCTFWNENGKPSNACLVYSGRLPRDGLINS